MKQLIQLALALVLAGAASILLLNGPVWAAVPAAGALGVCYYGVTKLARRQLAAAFLIAAFAPLTYTAPIFYLLATVESERPAGLSTYAAIAGYYVVGACALSLTAWLLREKT